jgi:hypothetical protein
VCPVFYCSPIRAAPNHCIKNGAATMPVDIATYTRLAITPIREDKAASQSALPHPAQKLSVIYDKWIPPQ